MADLKLVEGNGKVGGNVAAEITLVATKLETYNPQGNTPNSSMDKGKLNIFNFGIDSEILNVVNSNSAMPPDDKIKWLNNLIKLRMATEGENYDSRYRDLSVPSQITQTLSITKIVRSSSMLLDTYLTKVLSVKLLQNMAKDAKLVGIEFSTSPNSDGYYMLKSVSFYVTLSGTFSFTSVKEVGIMATRILSNLVNLNFNNVGNSYTYKVDKLYASSVDTTSKSEFKINTVKSNPSKFGLKGYKDLSGEKITEPFMFEVLIENNLEQKSNYDDKFLLNEEQIGYVKTINDYHKTLIKYVANAVSKPWHEASKEFGDFPLESSDHSPFQLEYKNIPDNVKNAWKKLLTELPSFGGTSIIPGQISMNAIMSRMVESLYNNLASTTSKDGNVEWSLLYSTYSNVHTVTHDGKVYLDNFSTLLGLWPVDSNPMPIVFGVNGNEYGGAAGLFTVKDIVGIFAIAAMALAIAYSVKVIISNIFGIAKPATPLTLGYAAIIGASVVGGLMLLYYIFFKRK